MAEEFDSFVGGLNAPAGDALEINVAGGDVTLQCCSRALFIGVSGDVRVQLRSGAIVTFRNVVAGIAHPWRVRKVFQAGTDAQGIVALW